MADPRSISNGTCFSAPGEGAGRNFIPCGNWEYGNYPCCQAGDFCLDDNACYNGKHGTTYLAGCSDSDYEDPSCPDKKSYKGMYDYPWAGLIYCKPNRWVACEESAKPTTITKGDECTCPPDNEMTVAFSAPPQITAIASLPARSGGTIEWQGGHLPTGEPTPKTFQPTFSSSTPSSSTSGSGFTLAPPSSTAISDSPHQDQGMSNGLKAGIGIGAAAGAMLLLGALSAFWMVFRRRRNDKSTPSSPEAGQAEMPSPVAVPAHALAELPMGPWPIANMANQTQVYGDLLVTMTSAYDWRWNDRGSGADRDGAFWHPKPQRDMRPMGSVVAPHHRDLPNQWAVLLVGDDPSKRPVGKGPAVRAPIDYQPLWTDRGSGSSADGSFWRPVAPPGYIAVGDVANAGYSKPDLDQVWCLRADLVADGVYKDSAVWDDKGSGAKADASFWDIIPRASNSASEYIPVLAGTFRCNMAYQQPDLSLAKVPALYVPKPTKPFSPAPPEVTKDILPEVGDTFSSIAHSSVTLPFTCFFDPVDRASLDNIATPFCTITKQVAWVVLQKFPNYQNSPYTQSQTVTTGIRKTDSTTTSHTAGVTISSEVGYGLAKWSVSLNYQFSFSQSSSVEEMEERTMTKTITVAPQTVAIAWGKRITITGVRADGSRIQDERAFNASDEIAVTDVLVK
ncbi:hypothetical protein VTI74DRAFT_8107 [Chaetomium olivicolor]